jgi:hypothetical protein
MLQVSTLHIYSYKSRKIPEQVLMFPRVESFPISRQSAHEGGKIVSNTQRPPLSHRKYLFLTAENESIRG